MERSSLIESIRRKYSAVRVVLHERGRRIWAASEARQLGRGGITLVGEALHMSHSTIRRGLKEIESDDSLPQDRSRQPGGGRKKRTEQHPTLKAALDALVEPTSKGDPKSPLRWTTKSTRRLAEELQQQGFDITKSLVCTLLHELGYQLSANRKSDEGGTHPDRNAQFEYINEQSARFLRQHCPVLSVDAKKKELIGNFKQNGKEWRPKGQPELVKVYDFIDKELGKATPYGIYDLKENIGWVNVGIDHDTAEFAVESLRRWWNHLGKNLYPKAKEIFITADGGGSNSSRSRLWKYCLQEFANETGLTIQVSHFPPGTSKWNKIEHRLFNHISMNWKGQPLVSLDVIINLIGNTTSQTGLKVYAMEDRNVYPTKRKITDDEMEKINIVSNNAMEKWNYHIKPMKNK
jgi:transposase